MTNLLFCCFVSLLLVCSSAEEEIGGKGVFVNKKDGLLEKKVPADEAVSDYLGDSTMYNLLQQFHLGEYSFLGEQGSTQLGLCDREDSDCTQTFLHYKRPLYAGRAITDRGLIGFGGVSLIPTTKAHIEQFALIALVDILVMNSDRLALSGLGGGNKNNILWHKTKPDVRNSVLLPIDNGWGAVFLLLSHNMRARGESRQEINYYYNEFIGKFRRLVQIIANANNSNMKEITQLAKKIWKKNNSIFSKMEIKKDKIIPTIVNFWMQNRKSVAEKIKTMTEQQLKDVVIPQLTALKGRLSKEKLAVFERKEEAEIWHIRQAIRKSLALILNSRSAAAYVDQREIYDDDVDDAKFEEEIEWLYRKKAKQFERVLRKAWRKTKNNDLAYSLSDFY